MKNNPLRFAILLTLCFPVVATATERILVPTAPTKAVTWQYTTEQPADDWMTADFDDSKWQTGQSGFGRSQTPGASATRTVWNSPDIWLRTTFDWDCGNFRKAAIDQHHDEDITVYLNGKEIFKATGFTKNYERRPIEIRRILVPGKNILAVHCHQTTGGQYIDVGIILDPKTTLPPVAITKSPDELQRIFAQADNEALLKRYQIDKETSWIDAIVKLRTEPQAEEEETDTESPAFLSVWRALWTIHPVKCDWVLQDLVDAPELLSTDAEEADDATRRAIESVIDELFAADETALESHQDKIDSASGADLLKLYVDLCEQRRAERLAKAIDRMPRVVYTRRRPFRLGFYAYTENIFYPGSQLRTLELSRDKAGRVKVDDRLLLDSPKGMFRDGDVSYDGQRFLISWRPEGERFYHIYEISLTDGAIRQITSGDGFVDFEPIYLPDGDILFSSSRAVQGVDCASPIVSNFFRCDKDGRMIRRLGFDQVHTTQPSVTDTGKVIYTRWDYNDRGQIYPQPLFQMNPDGTQQTEYYGNNSWFPTTLAHARAIPGENKVVAVVHGHHTWQAGWLAIVDRSLGTQEADGVQLIAPTRATEPIRRDGLGQEGNQFCYPYPIDQHEFISPIMLEQIAPKNIRRNDTRTNFDLYWVHEDGRRELLASDPSVSCLSPLSLSARPVPTPRPSPVDYRQATGTFYLQDIHIGPGLQGVPRGTIKKLRVVALRFRAANVGSTNNRGPGGGAAQLTPVATGNGTWDVKDILGEATVHADGSACFTVPARTAVYFQAIDDNGSVAATMRSWSTLMPGETFSCIGCHESKDTIATSGRATEAMRRGPETLEPLHGLAGGFSYMKTIQPIWDRHCVGCHDGAKIDKESGRPIFSLKAEPYFEDKASKRFWAVSYMHLTGTQPKDRVIGQPDDQPVTWVSSQSPPEMIPPYWRGSARSDLYKMLCEGHSDTKLSRRELDLIAAWIDLGVPQGGHYMEMNAWSPHDKTRYALFQRKREAIEREEKKSLEQLIELKTGQPFTLPNIVPMDLSDYIDESQLPPDTSYNPCSQWRPLDIKASCSPKEE